MKLTFLKLGGSLLSDKRREKSFRAAVIVRLAEEISAGELFRGLETERILTALLGACAGGERPNVAELGAAL